MKNTRDLITYLSTGNRVKYVYFWGHRKTEGLVTKTCFSQWYDAPFTHDGELYKTVEHFMMAAKARLFGDAEKSAEILAAENPGKAKALGREVRDFEQCLWDERKFEIVVRGNIEKFSQNPELKVFLLNTGARVLVEASPLDQIWGVGLAADDPLIEDPRNWQGENLLGFALMETRRRLRERE
ncbi:NADAR family protein [Denitrobaculum tricleocarpae]|uniref:NADAR family protein n=1 Tax=Denitrobaculum tricleocarpae TaxID=2591009 RepID=A0A545T5I0_9PROT|nr:NADAR family protein [Denitrobaculum tricleocarpae]TQV72463.1 NADAR family protein [Denitrobaculum tricleocarpae]